MGSQEPLGGKQARSHVTKLRGQGRSKLNAEIRRSDPKWIFRAPQRVKETLEGM